MRDNLIAKGYKTSRFLSDTSELLLKFEVINNQKVFWCYIVKNDIPTTPTPQLISAEIVEKIYGFYIDSRLYIKQ